MKRMLAAVIGTAVLAASCVSARAGDEGPAPGGPQGPPPKGQDGAAPPRPPVDPEVEAWLHEVAKRIGDPNEAIRRSAAQAVMALGPQALPTLEALAASDDKPKADMAKELARRIREGGPMRGGRRGPGGPGGQDGPQGGPPGGPDGFGPPPPRDGAGGPGGPGGDEQGPPPPRRRPGGPDQGGPGGPPEGGPEQGGPGGPDARGPDGRGPDGFGPPPEGGRPMGPPPGEGRGEGQRRPGMGPMGFVRRLQALGLSEDQQAKVKEILDATRKKAEELGAKARDGSMDFDAVRAEHQKMRKETEESLKALLTPEQLEKLAQQPKPPEGRTPVPPSDGK